jgi:hypothetical protein
MGRDWRDVPVIPWWVPVALEASNKIGGVALMASAVLWAFGVEWWRGVGLAGLVAVTPTFLVGVVLGCCGKGRGA